MILCPLNIIYIINKRRMVTNFANNNTQGFIIGRVGGSGEELYSKFPIVPLNKTL